MTQPSAPDPEFEALLRYLAASRGFDFTAYKRSSLIRRTRLRMQSVGVLSFGQYLDYLQANAEEFSRLFDALLINVTSFFRDTAAWDFLRANVVPEIVARKSRGRTDPIRVWSSACSSGEEAYSVAMLFADFLDGESVADRLKIYATDVDESALSIARAGIYSARAVSAIPTTAREKYIEGTDNRWVVKQDLRRSVIFGRHDLLRDAPIGKLDLLLCRNALMYFNSESQEKVIPRFLFALNEGGVLFLGKAESLLVSHSGFAPLDARLRIFKKVVPGEGRDGYGGPAFASDDPPRTAGPVEPDRLRAIVLDADPSAQVIIDPSGVVVMINAAARQLFHLTQRDVGRAIHELELSYRPVELRSIIERVRADRRTIITSDIKLAVGSEERWFEVQVVPLVSGDTLMGVRVAFIDTTVQKRLQGEVERSRGELETAYEELQSSNEELETTNEELQSTVEELETTNEELQSTNEELETMNEELQSTNEELEAVNEGMRARGGELDNLTEFLQSILRSLRFGMVVLSRNLDVEVWNPQAEDQWGLRFDEVRGRSFASLDVGLPVDALLPAVRECINDPSNERRLSLSAVNRCGHRVMSDVAIVPRLNDDRSVRGVILLIETRDGEPEPH